MLASMRLTCEWRPGKAIHSTRPSLKSASITVRVNVYPWVIAMMLKPRHDRPSCRCLGDQNSLPFVTRWVAHSNYDERSSA